MGTAAQQPDHLAPGRNGSRHAGVALADPSESGGLAPPLAAIGLQALQAMVQSGMEQAASALSAMSGVPLSITPCAVELLPLARVSSIAGSPEAPAIAVYVGFTGGGRGYLLLLLERSTARQLAALLLGDVVENVEIDDELAVSALAEAGNVSCSSFLNAVGEATGLCLHATPPVVADDMRGALMDVVVADVALLSDEALLMEAQFLAPGGADNVAALDARLLAIPAPGTLERVFARLTHAPGVA